MRIEKPYKFTLVTLADLTQHPAHCLSHKVMTMREHTSAHRQRQTELRSPY